MRFSAGAKIASYEILSQLGSGGMGEVYRAHDPRLGRDVAIKVLPADRVADDERRRRFVQEARAASALNHPNIVTIHEIESFDGVDFIVMEHVSGKTLDELIRPGVSLRDALKIGIQIAAALARAHSAGIIHRDLKPANVMVSGEGVVKVLDFGLAKLVVSDEASGEQDTMTAECPLSRQGAVAGTAGYMSPEQATGGKVDARSDIFGFGAVLYEMVTRRRAFAGDSTAETLTKIVRDEPTNPTDLMRGVPRELERLILRCLRKEPERRFQHMADLRVELEEIEGELGSPTTPQPATGLDGPARSVPLAMAVVPVALLALAGWALWRVTPSESEFDLGHLRFLPFAAAEYGEGSPAWSPDGHSLAYVARIGEEWQLLVKRVDGGAPATVLKATDSVGDLSWTRDAQRIAYVQADSLRWIARAGGSPAILKESGVRAASISPDGKSVAALVVDQNPNKHRLVLGHPPAWRLDKPTDLLLEAGGPQWLAWSPTSRQIATGGYGGGTRVAIWAYDVETRQARRLQEVGWPAAARGLAWLSERELLVSQRADEADNVYQRSLNVLDVATGRLRKLVQSNSDATQPAVSPQGDRIAFTADSDDWDVVEMPLDGGPIRSLVATGQWEYDASWSPVADEFAYVTANEIHIRNRSGSQEHIVVSPRDFPGAPFMRFSAPAFSPDGSRLAYLAPAADAFYSIWVSPTSGGPPARVPSGLGGIPIPSWSPDGQWIAFPHRSGVHKVRVGGTEPPEKLSDAPCGLALSWSPDGASILCGSRARIEIINADGSGSRIVGPGYRGLATWAKDGSSIYVVRDTPEALELGILDVKTTRFRTIARLPPGLQLQSPTSGALRLSLDRFGSALATTRYRATGDIWIVDGLSRAPNLWQRLVAPAR